MAAILEVEDLHKSYGATVALKNAIGRLKALRLELAAN